MITHTRAIILKSVDYQESSKIVTILSEEHGKMALLVRGIKKPKSKFAGLIESGHILDVVYYYKGSRSVQILSEASIHTSLMQHGFTYEKSIVLFTILEMYGQLIHEGEKNVQMFNMLINILEWMSQKSEISFILIPYVQIRAADALGLGISSELENLVKESDYFFNVETGSLSNTSDTNLSYKLTEKQTMLLLKVIKSRSNDVLQIMIENHELKQLIRHLDVYFKYHIDGYKDRKTDKLLEQII